MNRRLYQLSMRYGSAILFAGFILVFVTAFITIILNYMQTIEFSNKIDPSAEYWLLVPAFAIRSFVDAMLYATLMFTGSAFLYRADKLLEAAE